MPQPTLSSPSPRRRGEAGYNMVLLVVLMTVMNIGLAAMLPSFTATIQREKEEELVFRGLQYAEAIRVFQNHFQRLPVKLDELVEAQPRSIRQLWKDPMTEDGKWVLLDMDGRDLAPPPVTPQVPGTGPEPPMGTDSTTQKPVGQPGDVVTLGPIGGVRSRSSKASFLVWNGQQRYDEWRCYVNLLRALGGMGSIKGPNGGFAVPNPVAGRIPPMSSRWIGRPWDQSLVPGTVPGQNPTGGAGGPGGVGGPGGIGGAGGTGGVGGKPSLPPKNPVN